MLFRGRASENYEFEYRQKDNDCCIFRPVLKILLITSTAKFIEFQFGDPPTDEQVSVNTLMEEMKRIIV